MDRNDLLKEASAWRDSLPGDGVKLVFHPMDYPFILLNVFLKHARSDVDDFERNVNMLAMDYMTRWAMREVQERRVSEKTFAGFAIFKEQFSAKEVYEKIVSGKDKPANIFLPVSNAMLEVRRFGDCLGFKIKSNNSGSNIHENGTRLILEISRDDNAVRVSEFIHSIECIVPLRKEQGANNSVRIDLGKAYENLIKPYPNFSCVAADVFSDRLVSMYTSEYESYVSIGKYKTEKTELGIFAKFVHFDHQDNVIVHPFQWRKGNIEGTKVPMNYRFLDGGNLCLSITISSGLPEHSFMKDINPELDIHYQQTILRMAASSLYLQLVAHYLTWLSLRIV